MTVHPLIHRGTRHVVVVVFEVDIKMGLVVFRRAELRVEID